MFREGVVNGVVRSTGVIAVVIAVVPRVVDVVAGVVVVNNSGVGDNGDVDVDNVCGDVVVLVQEGKG